MIIIYLLTGASFLAIVITGAQGYLGFQALGVNHPTFALLSSILYLFTEVLVMFFFVGTGVSVKEHVRDKGGDPDYHRRSVAIKRKLYPPTLVNVLLVMSVFVTGGAVDTGLLPGWAHGLLFLFTIAHFARTIRVQHRGLKENTRIIWEMTGVTMTDTTGKVEKL
ncbi:MAG: hypothetical protein V3U24_06575 [Candidatus Neomarinimicrobiota bacterium]